MKTIKVGGDWAYLDKLDGKAIENGERLRVRWPDGTLEDVVAVVEKTSTPIGDMGHTYDAPVSEAYAELVHHGAVFRVRLAGLEAERLGGR